MNHPASAFSVTNVTTLDQLHQVWSFACTILKLPAGIHTQEYYAQTFAKTPQLLILAERDGRVCGCVLASVEGDHILVGAVAVAEDSRRMGIGRAMLEALEEAAKGAGRSTLILGARQEAEPFYLSCGFQPNLFIQLPEPDALERLKALNEGYEVLWEGQEEGSSKLMLRTPQISRSLQLKYEQTFPSCNTQYVFIKHL